MMDRSMTDGRMGTGKNEEVTRFQKYPGAEYSDTQAALEHKTLSLQESPPSGWDHRLHTLEDHRVGGGAGEEGAVSEASLQEAAAFSPSSHAMCSNTALG